jgi:two-component system OmpR family response regulator
MDQPQHILAVDDNEAVRDVIALLLREQGYRVTTADGGVSMREILQQEILKQDRAIDAVILDALMPGEGSEPLALYARGLGIPVVMVSGSPDKIAFAEENGLQLLRKPFRSEQLIDALKLAFDSGVAGQRPQASR